MISSLSTIPLKKRTPLPPGEGAEAGGGTYRHGTMGAGDRRRRVRSLGVLLDKGRICAKLKEERKGGREMEQMEDIGFLIKLIHDNIARSFAREVGSDGPTRTQYQVLHYLTYVNTGKVLVKDVMNYLHIDQSTASGIIKRMERNGYVTCSQDPEDRRQKIITITPAGAALPQPRAENGMNSIERTLLRGLSEEERQELGRLLTRVYEGLKDT